MTSISDVEDDNIRVPSRPSSSYCSAGLPRSRHETDVSFSDSDNEGRLHCANINSLLTSDDPSNEDDYSTTITTSSNVQPTHLSPYSVRTYSVRDTDTSSAEVEAETYTANTHSGFSDTDDEVAHKECKMRRLKHHLRRRKERMSIDECYGTQPTFSRVVVLRAAEKLIRGRARIDQRGI